MNNTLVHNNKSKQTHQIATRDHGIIRHSLRYFLYSGYIIYTEMPPAQIVQGAFIIISVRSILENVLDTYLSSPTRTDI